MMNDYIYKYGKASDVIPNIDENFEKVCLYVLIEAYKIMKNESKYDLNWKETRFSAHLIGYMVKIRNNLDIGIRIDPENHLYTKRILNGEIDPDTANRIDIKISGNWVYEDIYYGIEAKILIEKNWKKKKHKHLKNRYINTGIDNFINGIYADKINRGCIAGYIIQGDPDVIANDINQILINKNRKIDQLSNISNIGELSYCYCSSHRRTTDLTDINLHHIFLDFK